MEQKREHVKYSKKEQTKTETKHTPVQTIGIYVTHAAQTLTKTEHGGTKTTGSSGTPRETNNKTKP